MTPSEPADLTGLLKAWAGGEPLCAGPAGTRHAYDELRHMARRYMRRERAQNTLQATALVNEAYLRLVRCSKCGLERPGFRFFAVAAQMMRRILVDAARARASAKRGGNVNKVNHSTAVNFDEIPDAGTARGDELVAIDDALNQLAEFDPRKARS